MYGNEIKLGHPSWYGIAHKDLMRSEEGQVGLEDVTDRAER